MAKPQTRSQTSSMLRNTSAELELFKCPLFQVQPCQRELRGLSEHSAEEGCRDGTIGRTQQQHQEN